MPRLRLALIATAALFCLATSARAADDAPVWKTAYVKRGFVGNFESAWAGGPTAAMRNRTPLCVDGTKVRLFGVGSLERDVSVVGLWLVLGTDDVGGVAAERYPITFDGKPDVLVPRGLKAVKSDEVAVPVKRGIWYVEDRYATPSFPYAYEVDTATWSRDADLTKPNAPTSGKVKSSRTGITRRIDVLTTDKRPLIACFGDSITHGYGSTPNAGARYPDVLAKLTDRPVLNLGVNSDTISQNAHAANEVGGLAGVEQVVFLMGINDIVMGTGPKSAEAYAKIAEGVIAGFKQKKIRIVWCTIPPAGGIKQMDADPAKETLRVAINAWIRASNLPDAVADFDKALADPADPRKMRADCQSDWIHPNDKGYAVMGEVAAGAVKQLR